MLFAYRILQQYLHFALTVDKVTASVNIFECSLLVRRGKRGKNIYNSRYAHLYALSSLSVLLASWKISTSSG